MGYQLLYLVLYGAAAIGLFCMFYGFIPWHGKDFIPSETQDKSSRKKAKFGGFALLGLFLIKLFEIFNVW